MSPTEFIYADRPGRTVLREFTEQAIVRSSGSPLIAGNALQLLRDSTENYPRWLDAIATARRYILFENYIIGNDAVGRMFVEALAAKAREGVQVRLLYDWLGTRLSGRLFRPLAQAGGEVRCFNPPRLDEPLGWLSRDHRKMIAVDGAVAFVSGLCVAQRWMGDARRGIAPWRDTGVALSGPAVAETERAFAQVWNSIGPSLPETVMTPHDAIAASGSVDVMVVASEPTRSGLYRLDQFIATVARRSLWLTDAYFIGTPAYVEALRAAARDGVDVRLLVPGTSDLPVTQAFSRAGYRPLLEAGVRVFEWNGSMLHAKSAVADGLWSRVGSSNLNLASWLANYELDIAVHDEAFGYLMEQTYLEDLGNATEIVLRGRNRVRALHEAAPRHMAHMRGSASRAAASALRIGNTVGAAITRRRVLSASEAGIAGKFGGALLILTALSVLFPRAVALPLALITGWLGVVLIVKAWRLRSAPKEDEPGDDGGR